ncbi:MAG: hypothetical protein AAGJ38_00810 [Planctomycetota bacterium]
MRLGHFNIVYWIVFSLVCVNLVSGCGATPGVNDAPPVSFVYDRDAELQWRWDGHGTYANRDQLIRCLAFMNHFEAEREVVLNFMYLEVRNGVTYAIFDEDAWEGVYYALDLSKTNSAVYFRVDL